MKDPKNLTFIVIPYLTVCGALYHIAYWDTFKLNGLSLISISDIIKSSVYPIIYTLIMLIMTMVGFRYILGFKYGSIHGTGKDTVVGKKLNSRIGVSVLTIIWLLFVIWFYFNGSSWIWIFWGMILALPPFLYLANSNFLSDVFKESATRLYVIQILVNFVTLSFASGKHDSYLIRDNLHYKYILSKTQDDKGIRTDTMKFLGTSDRYFIFTNLKNDSTIMISSASVDTLILLEKNNFR